MAAALVCSMCFMTSCSDDGDANNVAWKMKCNCQILTMQKHFLTICSHTV